LAEVDDTGQAFVGLEARSIQSGRLRVECSRGQSSDRQIGDPAHTPAAAASAAGAGGSNGVTEFCDQIMPVRGARNPADDGAVRAVRGIAAAGSARSLQAKAFRILQIL
jgi:hypothetical protein